MLTASQRLERVIVAVIFIGFTIWGSTFIYKSSFIAMDGNRYFSLFDDAMISMKYAWNFSHGLGLVWNQGENVQGYTNLLMTLFMSFATLVFEKSNAVLFIQISGIIFMLAIAFVSMKIMDLLVVDEPKQIQSLARILTILCALSYYPLVYWSIMGMETGLLCIFSIIRGNGFLGIQTIRQIWEKSLVSPTFSIYGATRFEASPFY